MAISFEALYFKSNYFEVVKIHDLPFFHIIGQAHKQMVADTISGREVDYLLVN